MLEEKLWVLNSSKWGVFLCVCLCVHLGVYTDMCVSVSLCLYDYISVYVLCLCVSLIYSDMCI